MATTLTPEQCATYTRIIDAILAAADLDTVSAKSIRKGLQEEVGEDLTPMKKPITELIMERFDKVQREREPAIEPPLEPAASTTATTSTTVNGASATNGTHHAKSEDAHSTEATVKDQSAENDGDDNDNLSVAAPSPPSKKRKSPSSSLDDDDDSLSDVQDTPPRKKVQKTSTSTPTSSIKPESDEQMAKRLQAEFSSASRSRSTRGGTTTSSATKKKPTKSSTNTTKKTKKKSAAKIHSDDDSSVESSTHGHNSKSSDLQKEKKTGFHKPLHLSEPLQALLGESQLSRPETVKRIWAYVKERDLQDPNDKRQIRCDEAMRKVFKSEKVHMFTMNKVLATQLWPVEEGE